MPKLKKIAVYTVVASVLSAIGTFFYRRLQES